MSNQCCNGLACQCPPLGLVRQVVRARKPSYLEITAVLVAVGALGTWFGAMLI